MEDNTATNKHQFTTAKTARYYQLGQFNERTKAVWVALHGYGHRAEDFLAEFEPIADEHTAVIAPEAMNRFYLRGTQGKVGATWMTKDDRESDIADILNYLNGLLEVLVGKGLSESHKLSVLGFSQGGPAAFRWASQLDVRVDQLICWGSDIPKDVYLEAPKRNRINEMNLKLIVGDADEYISEESIDQHIMELHNAGVSFDFHSFAGKHEIHPDTLRYFQMRLLHDGNPY